VTVLLVAAGAAVGAPMRYVLDRAVQRRHDSLMPWGTLLVNVLASLVLGLLVGLAATGGALALVGIGFCGALSTWSTFAYETVVLAQRRAPTGWAYACLTLVGGLVCAALGWLAGAALR
jgi:CrcB protein